MHDYMLAVHVMHLFIPRVRSFGFVCPLYPSLTVHSQHACSAHWWCCTPIGMFLLYILIFERVCASVLMHERRILVYLHAA